MAKANKYTIKDLKKQFPNDSACLEYLFDNLHTRECSCGGTYTRLQDRKQFQCSKCRYQIAPMAGTLFEKSTTPLTLWFHAVLIFSNAKSGISAKEMERQLGVTYKTAWRILALIRASLGQGKGKLKGNVEMDEAFIGGRSDRAHKVTSKTIVIAAVEREGGLRAQTKPDTTASSIGQFLRDNVEKVDTRLFTDKSNGYGRTGKERDRFSVNHSRGEYVRGDVHVNNVESFWSHFKRSLTGTHKTISKKYLQTYLDGFVFHYNNRHSDRLRFETLLCALVR